MYYQQCACMLAHICHACIYEYVQCTLIHLLKRHIEMGPTQSSEGEERFPAS